MYTLITIDVIPKFLRRVFLPVLVQWCRERN